MAAIAPLLRQRADVPNALEAEQMDNAAQAQAVVEESRVRQRVAALCCWKVPLSFRGTGADALAICTMRENIH